jgi:phosphoenolpyruvate-protein kinase (PTS system EI component)
VVPDIVHDSAGTSGADPQIERSRALDVLSAVADELASQADAARARGHHDEAEILVANQAMAEDPALRREVAELAGSTSAPAALLASTERRAALLERLPDATLAARGADVREIGRRSARLLAGARLPTTPSSPMIVVARDLGPADVAELRMAGEHLRGIALAAGAVTSHTAIMARSLDLPLVVGLGERLLSVADGAPIVLDADSGDLMVAAGADVRRLAARRRTSRPRHRRRRAPAPTPVTRDGRAVGVLCNATGEADAADGIAAGAQGIGLLRSELAFLQATDWPRRDEHVDALRGALAAARDRVATIRVLDFGADKLPSFLIGEPRRGVELVLAHEAALVEQLRAILAVGGDADLRILLPFVEHGDQVRAVRGLLRGAAAVERWSRPLPLLGAMIETPAAVSRAAEIVDASDFVAIGTNDLVGHVLGIDRGRRAPVELAADPQVLRLVAEIVRAARDARRRTEVCGESAGLGRLAALFVGLGVDELSVQHDRVWAVRETVGALWSADAAERARAALHVHSAEQALALMSRSAQAGHDGGQPGDGFGGIIP